MYRAKINEGQAMIRFLDTTVNGECKVHVVGELDHLRENDPRLGAAGRAEDETVY